MAKLAEQITEQRARELADKEFQRERKEWEAERKELEADLAKLEKLLDLTNRVALQRVPKKIEVAPFGKGHAHHGVVTSILSDLHLDEVVEPEEVFRANKYNRKIAGMRIEKFFQKLVEIPRDYLSGITYDGASLFMLGDNFTGDIHDELRRTNADTLAGSIAYWLDPLVAGIRLLADEYGKVTVDFQYGNHSRNPLERRSPAKKRAEDNFDYLLARLIQRDFRNDSRVEISAPVSSDSMRKIYNCVVPGTRILTSDLRWVNVEDLQVGDKLVGFDEDLQDGAGRGRTRRWRESTVLGHSIEIQDVVEIEFASGKTLRCTPDHKWLCGTSYGFANKWVEAKDIRPGWSIRKWFEPWSQDEARQTGWLAGIFDGEGSLGGRSKRGTVVSPDGRSVIQPVISQNEGQVAEEIRRVLKELGFDWNEDHSKKCVRFVLRGGFAEYCRFLGTVRPVRLLEQFSQFYALTAPHMNALPLAAGNDVVVAVRPLGKQEIVAMGTSTKTYVAEGYGSHNTTFLLTHGDQFRGGSGIAGLFSPLMLGQHRKMKRQSALGKPFDVMCMGHWHQLITAPSQGLIVNGSVKGYDEYAFVSNFGYEIAQQALWITTPEHGADAFHVPVILQDRKKEGW